MKRDMDLIRSILLNVEADKYPYGSPVRIDGFSGEICGYHVALLLDAGLAEGRVLNTNFQGSVGGSIDRLTWAGHDFLDAARSDTIWNKAKEKVLKPGISLSFSLLLEFLKFEARAQMQKHGLLPPG